MNSFVREDGLVIRLVNNEMFGVIRMIQFPNDPLNPWFAGVDVARSLGYSNANDAVNSLPGNKQIIRLESLNWILNRERYNRRMIYQTTIIDQGGLYMMVMRSSLPKAEEFQKWIAYRVIPAIADGTINQISGSLQNELSDFGICSRKQRVQGRNELTSEISSNLKQSEFIHAKITNAVYDGVLGRTASQLKELSGDPDERKLRDRMLPEIGSLLFCAEQDAKDYIADAKRNKRTINDYDVEVVRRNIKALYGNNPYSFEQNCFPVHVFPFIPDGGYYNDEMIAMYNTAKEKDEDDK